MKIRCLICRSKHFDKLGVVRFNHPAYRKVTHLLRCKNCSFFWINPLPNEVILNKIYSGIYHYNPKKFTDLFINFYTGREVISDVKLVLKYKSEGRILDIGAGRGEMLKRFPQKFWEKWALDPYLSKNDKKVLTGKIGLNVNNYKALKYYPTKYFDVVVLRNVIEHTSQFKTLLRQINRILKKRGVVFIRTPNMDSADFQKFGTNWYTVNMIGHLVFFGEKSIKRALAGSNFSSKYVSGIGTFAPMALFRSVNSKTYPPFKFMQSLYFSLISSFHSGPDLRIIAQK